MGTAALPSLSVTGSNFPVQYNNYLLAVRMKDRENERRGA